MWPLGMYMTLIKALKDEVWALKRAFSVFVVKFYGFGLSIAYIAHPHHPYIESVLTLCYKQLVP